MFSTVLCLSLISLHAGEVCTLPNGTALVQPGKINWVLRDPTFSVPDGSRAIVTRIAPDGLADVAEVKLYDGTGRLGWIEAPEVTTVRSTMVFSAPAPRPVTVVAAPSPVKSYGVQVDPRRGRRKGHPPDFSAVNVALAAMASEAQAAYGQQMAQQDRYQQALMGSGRSAGGSGGMGFSNIGASSHLCGAATKTTGAPCKNRVTEPGYCYQHR